MAISSLVSPFPRIHGLSRPAPQLQVPLVARPRNQIIRGASPLGLPYALSRSALRRLAPFAWLRSLSSLAQPILPVLPTTSDRQARRLVAFPVGIVATNTLPRRLLALVAVPLSWAFGYDLRHVVTQGIAASRPAD